MLAIEISKRTLTPLECFSNPPEKLAIPRDSSCAGRITCCKVNGFDEICHSCRMMKEKQDAKKLLEQPKKVDLGHTKSRERMKKRARMNEEKNDEKDVGNGSGGTGDGMDGEG